jgi:ATP-dependent RNA helicase DeaD
VNKLKEFKELNLKHELLESLKKMNFLNMTEVQELSIPVVMQHKDVIVRSKTGSGKTGAFLIPIFQSIGSLGHPQALVLVPTRELASQVSTVAHDLSYRGGPRTTVVYGGASINVQMQNLRHGADLVIGTPGRIIDLIERGSLKLNRVKFLVMDEADLMLDMGFIDDVEHIISMIPTERQTILLSATMPREITDISRKHMKTDTVKITVGKDDEMTVTTIKHNFFIANGREKLSALLAYIENFQPKKGIIFTSTQRESEYVHRFLTSNGFDAIVMHGGLSQAVRERSLHSFREHARFLISTNLASRGLDIPDITDIINFDAPEDPRVYVHRVGRSARMGKDGRAFTIFGYDQESLMEQTSRYANVKLNHLDLDTAKFKDIKTPPTHSARSSGFRQSNDRGNSRFGNNPRGRSSSSRYSNNNRGSSPNRGKRSFGSTRHEYGGN